MTVDKDQQEIYVAIWSKAVDTQMHFNEMSVKSRQFGLAFVAAALGLAIVLLSQGKEFAIKNPLGLPFDLHATVLIILASALALHSVRILDLSVYHRMLRGAVTFGEDFEECYMKQIFDLQKGMTQSISHFSRLDDASTSVGADGRRVYAGTNRISAEQKIRRFYNFCIGALFVTAVVIFLFTGNFASQKQQPLEASPSEQHRTAPPSALATPQPHTEQRPAPLPAPRQALPTTAK